MQVANRAGSLADITGVIASHGINVQSLAVGSSEQPGRSRITVVVPRDDAGFADLKQKVESSALLGFHCCAPYMQQQCGRYGIEDIAVYFTASRGYLLRVLKSSGESPAAEVIIRLQVEALPIVGRVTDLTEMPFVARELMIVKVPTRTWCCLPHCQALLVCVSVENISPDDWIGVGHENHADPIS